MSITWNHIVLYANTALQLGSKLMARGIATWALAAVLCAAIAFWRMAADIETIGPRIICAIACLAAIWAARKGGYFLVAAFGGIAVIFNPFVPDMMSRIAMVVLYFVLASAGLLALTVLHSRPQSPALISLAVQRRVALDCRQQGQTL
jgi:hypothetical protein